MPQDPEDFDDSPIAGAPLRGLSTRRTVLSAFGASAVLAPAALAESGLHADPTAPLRQTDSVDLDRLIKQLRKQDAPAVAEAIVAALGTVGVPVFASEGDAETINAVAGTELPLAVSPTQVRAMATELVAGTGLFGTDLDDLTGAPAEGMASASLLLAAWTRSIDSTGAILARGIMGKRNWKRYEQLRYPNLVQLLFAADIVRDSVEAGNATLSRRNLLASVGPIMPLRRPRFEATVCGTMSGFVDSMLNAVVNALKFTVGEGEQGTVSGFFKDLWNGVVDLATTAAKKVLDSLTAPVVNVIKSIAVALSIGISVLTYLKPWEIVISFDQEPTRFGLGSEVVTGTAFAKVYTGFDQDFSNELTDCAMLAGIALPDLAGAGSPLVWQLIGEDPIDLMSLTSSDSVVPKAGSAEAHFETNQEPEENKAGPVKKGTATFRVDIDNAGLKTFQSTITKQLFQFLPDLVANVLAPTLGPIINDMLGKLLDLGSPRQTAELSVIYHDKGDPTSTPDPAQPTQPPDDGNAGDCPYGTWYVDDMADVVAAENAANGGSDVIFEDISGTSQVTFKTDGSYKWTWSDYVFKGLSIVPDVGSVEVKMTFNGTISGTFDLGESGLRIMSASNNLRIHGEAFLNGASIGEIPVDETAWVRSGQTMVISCGTGSESMTLRPDWLASSARYQLTKAK